MAKRREQKDETESKDFEMPKFDKEGFINKEKEKIKATFIAFAFAFVIALISFGFWVLLENSPFQWALVILFGIFSASWIQYLFKQFSVDMEKIERKGKASEIILKEAKKHKPSHIVVHKSDKSKIDKRLSGSVSDEVCKESMCIVKILR